MRVKLTDKFIQGIQPDPLRKIDYFDSDRRSPTGFLVYCTPAGYKAFALSYQDPSGRTRRYTIGAVASYPLAEARAKVAEIRRGIDNGVDPLAERTAKRAAPTVAEWWEQFAAGELNRRAPSTRDDYRALANKYILPALGSQKVEAVSRQSIEKLFRSMTDAGHSTRANRMRAVLSILFKQAVSDGLRADNPVRFVATNREDARQRYLNGDELQRLLSAVERQRAIRPDIADVVSIALLTGSRRGEILGMDWTEIESLDTDHPTWVKPASRTKQRRLSRIPLSEDVAAILRRRHADPVRPLRGVFCIAEIDG